MGWCLTEKCIAPKIENYLDNAGSPEKLEAKLAGQRGASSDNEFSRDDFRQLVKNVHGIDAPTNAVAKGMFKEFDADGNGMVTMQEWNARRAQK